MIENIKEFDKAIALVVKNAGIKRKFLPAGKLTYESFLSNKLLMLQVIRKGIPYYFYSLVHDNAPFDEIEWGSFLDIASRSLYRFRHANKHFGVSYSAKILEIAEVTYAGLKALGTMEAYRAWIDAPNPNMGDMTPLDLLQDSYGKDMVLTELIRLGKGKGKKK